MEQSRKDFYYTHLKQKEEVPVQKEILLIDTGDTTLKELYSDEDHLDAEIEIDYYSHLKNIFLVKKEQFRLTWNNQCEAYCIYWGKRVEKEKKMIGMIWNVRGIGSHIKKILY